MLVVINEMRELLCNASNKIVLSKSNKTRSLDHLQTVRLINSVD